MANERVNIMTNIGRDLKGRNGKNRLGLANITDIQPCSHISCLVHICLHTPNYLPIQPTKLPARRLLWLTHTIQTWWREVLGFGNAVVALPEGSVWRDILQDNLADQACRRNIWSGQVSAFLVGIGLLSGPLRFEALNEQVVLENLLKQSALKKN